MREFVIPAGGEWTSRLPGWAVVQVSKGTGYCLHPQLSQELETGSLLLIAAGTQGTIRASQLGEMAFHAFNVLPERLTGLITLFEQSQLKVAESRKDLLQILPPDSPAAIKMHKLHAAPQGLGLLFRLKLLQFFVEMIGHELERFLPADGASDAKLRLQLFLKTTSSSELLEMNFNELAQRIHCTSRHLGRIFQELVGMSFRDKRGAIRLERARELLATTDSKIVDVALESGFKSLSLFNLMFARHYGMSPGKWRQKQEVSLEKEGSEQCKSPAADNRPKISLQVNLPLPHGHTDQKNIAGKSRKKSDTSLMTKGTSRYLLVS